MQKVPLVGITTLSDTQFSLVPVEARGGDEDLKPLLTSMSRTTRRSRRSRFCGCRHRFCGIWD